MQEEAYSSVCVVPKLMSARDSIKVWGAIWHGGWLDLSLFDQSRSKWRKARVTAAVCCDQVISSKLKLYWDKVSRWSSGYGRPWLVENDAKIHTLCQSTCKGAVGP